MKRLSKLFKPSVLFQTIFGKFRRPSKAHISQFTPLLYFSPQFHFSNPEGTKAKPEVQLGNEGYTPLPGGRQILLSLRGIAVPEHEMDYLVKYFDLYSVSSYVNSFTKEDARGVFTAISVITMELTKAQKPVEALKWMEHCVRFGERARSVLGPDELRTFHSISEIIPRLKLLEAAEKVGQTGQKETKLELAETVKDLIKAGLIHYKLGDKEKALEYFAKGVKIVEEEPDMDYQLISPNLKALYTNYIGMLDEKGEKTEAEKKARKGIEVLEKVFGPDCPEIGNMAKYMMDYAIAQDKPLDLFTYATKFKNSLEKEFGKDCVGYVSASLILTKVNTQMKKYTEALENFQDIEKYLEQNPKQRHLFPINYHYYLMKMRCFCHFERWEEAENAFEQAKEHARNSFGEISKEMGECYFNAAQAWSENCKRPKEAKILYENAIDLYQKVSDSFQTGIVLHTYGAFLSALAEFENANQMLEKSIEYFDKRDSFQAEWLEKTYGFIGLNCTHFGQYEYSFNSLTKAIQYCIELGNSSGRLNFYEEALAFVLEEAGPLKTMKWTGKNFVEKAIQDPK